MAIHATVLPNKTLLKNIRLNCKSFTVCFLDIYKQEWLTKERCATQIICRGLGRVLYIESLDKVLWFLTRRGLINVGLLSVPRSPQSSYISNKFIKPVSKLV